MEVVRLGPDDWEMLRDLRLRAVEEEPYAFAKTYEEEAKTTEEEWREKLATSSYFFAKEDDKPVGMVCTVREKGVKLQHIARMFSVYVVPEARSKGIGSALMRAAMDELERDPTTVKIKLYVSEMQKEAQGLYEKMGFKIMGTQEKEMYVNGKYSNTYALEKNLH